MLGRRTSAARCDRSLPTRVRCSVLLTALSLRRVLVLNAAMDTSLDRFTQLRPRVLGVAYRMLGSMAEAEDVAQEVWLRWNGTDRDAIENLEARWSPPPPVSPSTSCASPAAPASTTWASGCPNRC